MYLKVILDLRLTKKESPGKWRKPAKSPQGRQDHVQIGFLNPTIGTKLAKYGPKGSASAAAMIKPINETPNRTAPSLYPQNPAIANRIMAKIQMSMVQYYVRAPQKARGKYARPFSDFRVSTSRF